jgi:hypothetical protein
LAQIQLFGLDLRLFSTIPACLAGAERPRLRQRAGRETADEKMFKYFSKTVDGLGEFCNSERTHGKTQTTYMRTIKALVCAAALAAGLATSLAQSNVYSINVVGYYNIPAAAGQLVVIANQLNTTNNTLGALIPNPPPSSFFYKFTGSWGTYQFDPDDLTWYPDALVTMNLGEGAMFKAPANTTLTFVGEVAQGNLSTALGAMGQIHVASSQVPQAGSVSSDLGFPAEPSDFVYKYTGSWGTYQFDPDDLTFYPSEPTFGVGEGFMFKKAAASTIAAWTRSFTVQ